MYWGSHFCLVWNITSTYSSSPWKYSHGPIYNSLYTKVSYMDVALFLELIFHSHFRLLCICLRLTYFCKLKIQWLFQNVIKAFQLLVGRCSCIEGEVVHWNGYMSQFSLPALPIVPFEDVFYCPILMCTMRILTFVKVGFVTDHTKRFKCEQEGCQLCFE